MANFGVGGTGFYNTLEQVSVQLTGFSVSDPGTTPDEILEVTLAVKGGIAEPGLLSFALGANSLVSASLSPDGRLMSITGTQTDINNFFNGSDGSALWFTSTDDQVIPQVAGTTTAYALIEATTTVQASQLHGITTEFSINISPVNDPAFFYIAPANTGTGSVKEDVTLSTTVAFNVQDVDGGTDVGAPTVVLQGSYGTVTIDAGSMLADGKTWSGNWIYALSNSDTTVQALAEGQKLTDIFKLKAIDGTEQFFSVEINGTNDTPLLGGPGGFNTAEQTVISLHPESAAITGSSYIVTDDGAATDVMTLQIRVRDPGNGPNGFFEQGNLSASSGTTGVLIDPSSTNQLIKLSGTKAQITAFLNGDNGSQLDFTPIGDAVPLHVSGTPNGFAAVGFTLTDSLGAHSEMQVSINVSPVEDDLVNRTPAAFSVNEDAALKLSGLSVFDPDLVAGLVRVQLQTTNGTGTISASSSGGVTASILNPTNLILIGQLADINAYLADINTQPIFTPATDFNGTVNLRMTSTDLGLATVKLISTDNPVNIAPVNDAAIIGGVNAGSVTEDATLSTVVGTLTITDVDGTAQQSFSAGTTAGNYGSLALAANGEWTYSVNNALAAVQALNAGQTATDTIAVSSVDGTTSSVAISINGANELTVGTPGNDTLTGTSGNDIVNGLAGSDMLLGLAGNDALNGGAGADIMVGGIGADAIDTGSPNDNLSDRVRFFASNEFADTISNFDVTGNANQIDKIQFGAALNTALDDGNENDSFLFATGNGGLGAVNAVVGQANSNVEALLLTGANGEGVSTANLTSAAAVSSAINAEFNLVGPSFLGRPLWIAADGEDALLVVNDTNGNSFSVWQWVQAGGGETSANELTLIGLVNGNGTVGTNSFEFII